MVCLLATTLLMVDVVQAVFTPADRDALKAAVGTCNSSGVCTGGCFGETADGSCPTFAASNDATGNPYGVIGDWDVSSVTSMEQSKSYLSRSMWPRLSLLCFFNTTTRVSSDHIFHTFFFGIVLFVVLSYFFLLHPLLQCFNQQPRSIKTCQNGTRMR